MKWEKLIILKGSCEATDSNTVLSWVDTNSKMEKPTQELKSQENYWTNLYRKENWKVNIDLFRKIETMVKKRSQTFFCSSSMCFSSLEAPRYFASDCIFSSRSTNAYNVNAT